MTIDQAGEPRLFTPKELAVVVRMYRESKLWSQETLAALAGVSVRTVQRVEKGDPSDLDTRRALARALEFEISTSSTSRTSFPLWSSCRRRLRNSNENM